MALCRGRRRAWATLTIVSALALCGAAVYLFISVHDVVVSANCVISRLSRLATATSSVGASAVQQLPVDFLDVMKKVMPYLDYAAILPAIISMLFMLLAGSLGCGLRLDQ